MKKIISLIIGSALLFVLAGCKDPKQASKSSSTQIKPPDVMLTVPDDYTGIMHVLLTINVKNSDDYVSGGITQLNQFLEIYNKKEDD